MEVYGLLASGYGDWPIIKQIAWLLGQVMNGIFNVLSKIGIENIGVCIIIFTIIIYTLMIPLTIKQQKFSKMSAVMQPEIKKIQKKCKILIKNYKKLSKLHVRKNLYFI